MGVFDYFCQTTGSQDHPPLISTVTPAVSAPAKWETKMGNGRGGGKRERVRRYVGESSERLKQDSWE
eukprot:627845-Hanusia_phi.AAC.3